MKLLCLLVASLLIVGVFGGEHGESYGFNDGIDWWNNLDEAMEEIKSSGKPGLVIIHKSWCGACKNLKRAMDSPSGAPVVAASSDFVMVNLPDKNEPKEADFKADGSYIPRLFFVDTTGKVRTDMKNPQGSDKYKYYYSAPAQIADAMKTYLPQLKA